MSFKALETDFKAGFGRKVAEEGDLRLINFWGILFWFWGILFWFGFFLLLGILFWF
jgi:hypothetical protein